MHARSGMWDICVPDTRVHHTYKSGNLFFFRFWNRGDGRRAWDMFVCSCAQPLDEFVVSADEHGGRVINLYPEPH